MPPLSAQSNSSQTPTRRPLKRSFSSTLPASGWVVSKKVHKQPDIETRMPPLLPPVQSDTALAIFIHSSLKSSEQNDRFGDAERLAFMGRKVLEMAIAEVLFEKRPMLDAVELNVSARLPRCTYRSHIETTLPQEEFNVTLSTESYEQWVSLYGLREKVACTPEHREELKEPGVRFRKLEVGDQLILTREHRRHSIYLTPTWVLCT